MSKSSGELLFYHFPSGINIDPSLVSGFISALVSFVNTALGRSVRAIETEDLKLILSKNNELIFVLGIDLTDPYSRAKFYLDALAARFIERYKSFLERGRYDVNTFAGFKSDVEMYEEAYLLQEIRERLESLASNPRLKWLLDKISPVIDTLLNGEPIYVVDPTTDLIEFLEALSTKEVYCKSDHFVIAKNVVEISRKEIKPHEKKGHTIIDGRKKKVYGSAGELAKIIGNMLRSGNVEEAVDLFVSALKIARRLYWKRKRLRPVELMDREIAREISIAGQHASAMEVATATMDAHAKARMEKK